MITIYHNPRCSKSREGVELLAAQGNEFTMVKYLENGLTKEEITGLLQKLDIKPIELVRQKEVIWTEKFKGKNITDTEIIEALHLYPQLIERPIVVNGSKAVIARPAQNICNIL